MKQQVIHSGFGKRELIASLPEVKAATRVMVVCDYAPLLSEIGPLLEEAGVPWVHFGEFGANPVYEDLMEGARRFTTLGCDLILSVGGGSAMDTAKGILLFSQEPGFLDGVKSADEVKISALHIAMPTTAGTGSESTHFAVLYRNGVKESAVHLDLLPDVVVLDPHFLRTLPDYQKKSTAMDAICQAIESYWSKKSSPESRAFSGEALMRILPNLDSYLEGSEPAMEQMLLGSNFAGRAINLTQTTAPHAMSYKLSTLYGVAHGHAVALCMPGVMRKTAEKLPFGSLSELCEWFGVPDLNALANWLQTLTGCMGLKLPVQPSEEEYRILAASVNAQRLGNHPVALSPEEIEFIYRQIPQK